jgi:polysaccharide deacetylase family protein (PEP-CTERM system associated)
MAGAPVCNCLTVDVEEWFHVCGVGGALAPEHWEALPSRVVDNTKRLLDLFDRCGVRGTFFVLGWIARRYPDLVADIASAGHEIGSHGDSHRRVYELTPAEFAAELDASVAALGAAGARAVRGFRAPEWSINDRSLWALDLLAQRGFRFDSSMTPLRIIGNPRYPTTPYRHQTSAGPLLEFPPLVARRLGQQMPLGGGWGLRMSTPTRVVATIARHNDAGTSVALFVHPWEVDPDPPRVRLPLPQRFVHYFRLEGFAARLEQIARSVLWCPMGEALDAFEAR